MVEQCAGDLARRRLERGLAAHRRQRALAGRVDDEVDHVVNKLLVGLEAGGPVGIERKEVTALGRREEGPHCVVLESVSSDEAVADRAGGALVNDLADPPEQRRLDEEVGVLPRAGRIAGA